jgi:hypothetical protein
LRRFYLGDSTAAKVWNASVNHDNPEMKLRWMWHFIWELFLLAELFGAAIPAFCRSVGRVVIDSIVAGRG